ncbi:hypothetical protein NQ318_006329 [Aromia moschata]|uniref:BET1 homolog n=1 Tax=Aromia moschata TaxID=1265417 RepID=A0AAV8XX82_9CUCU|nr:hypothetical protein NQ318_006329 [Aromia moschata]
MRRAHAGNYYEPLSQNSNEIEDENERMTNELQEKVQVLKSLTIDIGNEVKYQDRLLRDVDDDLDRTGGFLGTTMNKLYFFVLYLVLMFSLHLKYVNMFKEELF